MSPYQDSQTTIWSSSTLPGTVDAGIDNPVELGVKFYSDVGGTIKAIRFYKSIANTGPHIGNLWMGTQAHCSRRQHLLVRRHQAGNRQTLRRRCRSIQFRTLCGLIPHLPRSLQFQSQLFLEQQCGHLISPRAIQ